MDAFTITLILIVACTLVAAFVRRVTIDKCLKDFRDNTVNLIRTDGAVVKGKLRVENTGLELIYPSVENTGDGVEKATYILYKQEYPNIFILARFHDELTTENRLRRDRQLQKTYHPKMLRRLKRKIANVFRTIRDSFSEVLNLLIARVKRTAAVETVLAGQDRYVDRMKQELVSSVGTSYEPLLERYIGHRVVLQLVKSDKLFEYTGVLKDYTAEFIELMDVDYKLNTDEAIRKADIIVRRQYGVVRHLGEKRC